MHKLSVAAANDRLALEEQLETAERRIAEHLTAAERKQARERSLMRLLETWDETPFAERQAGLRDAVARIVVSDEGIRVTLRP
jgi:hypothetical protein